MPLPAPDPALFREDYSGPVRAVEVPGRGFRMHLRGRFVDVYGAGTYEGFSADLLVNVAARCSRFVDVGAHFGYYSLLLASAHPGLEVLALEPVPESFALLRRSLADNGLANLDARPLAASDRPGEVRLFRSLASDNCGFYAHPVAPPVGELAAEAARLDDLLADARGPLLVKIDTDGHEMAVLDGLGETLARLDDVALLIELNPKMQVRAGHEPGELLERLDGEGFAVFFLDDRQRRARRWRPESDWRGWMDPASFVNLYCPRRERATNVCFFSHSAHLAGAERTLLEMVRWEVRREGSLATVVLPGPGPLQERLRASGAAVVVGPADWWCRTPVDAEPDPPRDLPASAGRLVELLPMLRELDPDVVVSNTLVAPWGALAAALLGKPHVWSVCEYGDADHGLRFDLPPAELRELILRSSDLVLTATDSLRRELFPQAGEERVRTLYRLVETSDGPAQAPEGVFARPGWLKVGLFAGYSESKGQRTAVRAIAELAARGVEAELVIAGQPAAETEVVGRLAEELGVAGRVRLLGFLDDPGPLMRACDVVLVPSIREAFGRSGIEAARLGKPVVFSSGALSELVPSDHPLRFSPGDVAGLADRLQLLTTDPVTRRRLGDELRDAVDKAITEEGYGRRLHGGLRQAIAAGRRSRVDLADLLAAPVAGLQARDAELTRRLAASEAEDGRLQRTLEEERAGERERRAQEGRERAALEERWSAERESHAAERDRWQAEGRRQAEMLASAERRSRETEERLATADDRLRESEERLATLASTRAWRAAVLFWRLLDRIAPAGSRRRRLYRRLTAPFPSRRRS